MKITWDEHKRSVNLVEHEIDFAVVTEAFFADAKVVPSYAGRFRAIGLIDGRPRAVIYKPLGMEAVSIISVRVASRKERLLLR